jgi:hypothetical protein
VRWALAALGLCAACTGAVTVPAQEDGAVVHPVAIHGRVLDLESCPSPAGCVPVAGVTVALAADRGVVAAPTGREGAFLLEGVPPDSRQLLVVGPPAGAVGAYVPTLNANPVGVAKSDVFGVELYVLSGADADLLGAMARESTRDFRVTGGYLGEVIERTDVVTAVAGAHVELLPAQFPMRYVNVIPRFAPGEPALQPEAAGLTSAFGLFAVATLDAAAEVAILVTADGLAFDLITVPMAPGEVAFGLHPGVRP